MKPEDKISPVKALRREKILDTAQKLFAQYGFRATTMEGIAAAVGMSKVTIYSYFKDKDALFAAVADRFVRQIENAVTEALRSDRSLTDRVTDGLVCKYELCYEILRSSAFSSELFSAGGDAVAELEQRMRGNIEQALSSAMCEAGISSTVARDRARLLSAVTHGIEEYVTDKKVAVSDMRTVVAAIMKSTTSR